MADLATIIEQLRTALTENERQRDQLLREAQSIEGALVALGLSEPPTATVTHVAMPPKAETMAKVGKAIKAVSDDHQSRTPKKPAADEHKCPTCGDTLPTARGLAIHTSLKHKAIDAAPAPAAAPAVAPVKSGEKVLACGECDYEVPIGKVGDLNRHCLAEHHRTATPTERTPVVAA